MSTILYWFSGTGNSLVAARELAKRLGPETELVPMAKDPAGAALRKADRVGIVFPVYFMGPPLIVREFLRKAPIGSETYLFGVATYGAMAGRTFHFMRRILTERKLDLAAGWGVTMPGNYLVMYPAWAAARQQKFFARAAARYDAIARAIQAGTRGVYQDSPPPISWLLGPFWRRFVRRCPGSDRKYFATDACTRCGLCERVCPAADIRLADGRPTWLGHCEQCMACIQWCSVEAIQYGRKTQGRARYRHPEVKAEDLCVRS